MLAVPRTIPSRCTTRLGGGSSAGAAGAGAVRTGALVVVAVSAGAGTTGVSVGAVATCGASATVAGAGAASVGVMAGAAGGSCLRDFAPPNAKASPRGPISSPPAFGVGFLPGSPRLSRPSTLKFSPGPARTFNFLARTVLLVGSISAELTQTWMLAGKRIFAHAEGSSGPDFLRMISPRTVTGWSLVTWPTTSPLSPAWPRTLTLLAMTEAGPATSGTVLNSAAASLFFTAAGLANFFL